MKQATAITLIILALVIPVTTAFAGWQDSWTDRKHNKDQTDPIYAGSAAEGDILDLLHKAAEHLQSMCQPSSSSRFVDNGDGTISDNQTGLMWVKIDRGGGPLDMQQLYSVLKPSDEPLPQINALANATVGPATGGGNLGVGLSFAGGYTDWRLPTITELMTLIDLTAEGCGNGDPCIDPIFDTNCSAGCLNTNADPQMNTCSCTVHTNNPEDLYMSSTSYGPLVGWWGVNFQTGTVVQNPSITEPYVGYVRVVRRIAP